MEGFTLTVELSPSLRDIQTLTSALDSYATQYVGVPGFQSIGVILRDETDIMIGGALGQINWNWLFISIIWLPENMRRKGYGSKMLSLIESEARSRGCLNVHLDTFSFEARPFYEKFGYEVFATLEDYPPGHQRFFMRKILA